MNKDNIKENIGELKNQDKVDNESVVSKSKETKVTKGASSKSEKKERAARAAKTVGREVVDESEAKKKEMSRRKGGTVKLMLDLYKNAPLSAKAALFGYIAYDTSLKRMTKNYETQMKEWKRQEEAAKACKNGDTFSNTYQRIMAQYQLEKLEKKAKRIQKLQGFSKQIQGHIGRTVNGLQRATQVMAQKQTQEAFIGESQNKAAVVTASAMSLNTLHDDYYRPSDSSDYSM